MCPNFKLILSVFTSFLLILSIANAGAGDNSWRNKLGSELKEYEKNFEAFQSPKKITIMVWSKNKKLDKYGTITHDFSIIPALAMEITVNKLESLAKNPSVSKIRMAKKVHLMRSESVPMIKADSARINYDLNGTGVNISIVDSGIYNHTEFQSPNRILSNQKCYCQGGCCPNGSNEDDNATDDNGHGTHCAGIAAGEGDSNGNGVARNANLLAVKVLNSSGSGYEGDIIKGIEWAVNNGANIISLSLGTSYDQYSNCYDVASSEAVDNATKNGVLVVVASGNSGPGNETIAAPACAKRALTVGSVNDTGVINSDKISYFSSRGPTFDNRIKPDLMAPGIWLDSTYSPTGTCGGISNQQYCARGGTSQAAPHMAGVAALLYERYKEIHGNFPNPDLAKTILLTSVNMTGMKSNGYTQRNNWYGSGRIDAKKAVEIINYTKNNTVNSNETQIYKLNVTSQNFITTLYWPEDKDTNNNLDLIVGNSTHNFTYPTDENDSIEQIFLYNISAGIWNIYVKGKKIENNQTYYLVSDQNLTEDSIPPNLLLLEPRNRSYNYKTGLPLNFTTDSTNHTIWYTINDENKTVIHGNTTFNRSSDGTYYLTLYVNDSYNNINSSTVYFTVDTQPPIVNILSPNRTLNKHLTWFNLSFNENINLSLLSINNKLNHTMNRTNSTYFYNKTVLSEGIYNVTFYMNDTAGNENSTFKQFNISIAPIFNSTEVNKPLIIPNKSVNITANITEENFDLVWVNISYPGGSQKGNMTNKTPSQFEWIYQFNQTNTTGRYNITIFVNDTFGNLVNTSNLNFQVSTPVNFSSNSTDGKGNKLNVKWKFYYEDMEKIYKEENTNSTNFTIPSGLWDIELSKNNFSVFIESLNISTNFNKNLNLKENTSLENISNSSMIFHKISSFFWNISFSRANITIPFNLSLISNKRNVFKCFDWNFTTSNCESQWENITSNSTFSSAHTYLNTSSFSAFSIVETCAQGCGSWGSCSNGKKTRECTRLNCSTYTETKSCNLGNNGGNVEGIISLTPTTIPECTSDFDCSAYETCSQTECVNVTCDCGYFKNHSCISYECCFDSDCFENETCENHTCRLNFNLTLKRQVEDLIKDLEEILRKKSEKGFNITKSIETLEKARLYFEKNNFNRAKELVNKAYNEIPVKTRTDENGHFIYILISILLFIGLILIFKYSKNK